MCTSSNTCRLASHRLILPHGVCVCGDQLDLRGWLVFKDKCFHPLVYIKQLQRCLEPCGQFHRLSQSRDQDLLRPQMLEENTNISRINREHGLATSFLPSFPTCIVLTPPTPNPSPHVPSCFPSPLPPSNLCPGCLVLHFENLVSSALPFPMRK